jgi:hypothetical protein
MGRNAIQFQKELSLPEFEPRDGTDAQCEAALVPIQWPSRFRTPRCNFRLRR